MIFKNVDGEFTFETEDFISPSNKKEYGRVFIPYSLKEEGKSIYGMFFKKMYFEDENGLLYHWSVGQTDSPEESDQC